MRSALIGSGVGGVLGGAKGLYDSHGSNFLQSGNRLESTLGGALKGMGAGALIGGGYGAAKPLFSKAKGVAKASPGKIAPDDIANMPGQHLSPQAV
jgi:hypothetical protein